jgi:hypothetical protein
MAAQVGPWDPQSPQRDRGCDDPDPADPVPEERVGLKDDEEDDPREESADFVLLNMADVA